MGTRLVPLLIVVMRLSVRYAGIAMLRLQVEVQVNFVELQQTEHGAAEPAPEGRRMVLLVLLQATLVAEALMTNAAFWSVQCTLKWFRGQVFQSTLELMTHLVTLVALEGL